MDRKKLTIIYICLAVFFGICLLTGTFLDLDIEQHLYSEGSVVPRLVSFLSFYVFISSCMFFIGVLMRQLLSGTYKKPVKAAIVIIFLYLYASTATLGGGEFINDPLFTGTFKDTYITFYNCLVSGTMFLLPWFVLGIILNRGISDKKTIRSIIKLIVIMTMVYISAIYFNTTVIRPRYRLLESAESFNSWYQLKGTGKIFMSLRDLISEHPGSFISGHAMYAVLLLIILPSYSLVFPKLKGKESFLTAAALILIVPILICRMISGDNYLSDIALGGISAVKICFSFNALSGSRKSLISKLKNKRQ